MYVLDLEDFSRVGTKVKEEQQLVKEKVAEVVRSVPGAGELVHMPDICTGCGICELMCSFYHEGMQAPALARLQVVNDPFTSDHARIRMQTIGWKAGKKVALECDLCRGREAGPICVEYCPAHALGFKKKKAGGTSRK